MVSFLDRKKKVVISRYYNSSPENDEVVHIHPINEEGMNMYENCRYPLIVRNKTEYKNTKEEGKGSGRKDSSKDQDDNDELENPSCSGETGKENELDKNKNYSNSNDNFCQRRSSRKHTTPSRYGEEFCKLAMDEPIPYKDAIPGTEEEQWKKAIVEELDFMEKTKYGTLLL
ncbi:hypothetical protein JTB14_012914 [Gonioctena quinquepunctata]|nr:hypothetical protein JTB14_012914 [Gonioctena quinquepunctata]